MKDNSSPIFHITGGQGWINDPNGLVKFNGKYHIFYQYHPYSCEWGPMHWGHVVSEDLLHFRRLPIALTPGDEFDKDGCFSGTALVKDNILYIVYTGFINNDNPDDIKQIQCLASSEDGIHFVKHGAIITGEDLPDIYKSCDFRDPKLVYKDGLYYLFAVAKKKSGGGSIVLYKSQDLKKWEFVSDVLTHNSEGKMLECVDYHEDLNLILYSEQDIPMNNSYQCHNIHSCAYEIGKLNDEYKFISKDEKKLLDYGFDFYAAQIINNENILIAWLNMWGRNNPTSKYGFAGMLTTPRKVYIEDGILTQKPLIYGEITLDKDINNHIDGHLDVGVIHLNVEGLEALSINLRKGDNEVSKFYLKDNEFYFDRSNSGEIINGEEKDELSLKGIRKLPYMRKDNDDIYIVLDKYSIEIFVNGISMSNIVVPNQNSDIYEIDIKSNKVHIEVYK